MTIEAAVALIPLKSTQYWSAAHMDANEDNDNKRILFYSGMIHKIGKVRGRNGAVTDWMEQKREQDHNYAAVH